MNALRSLAVLVATLPLLPITAAAAAEPSPDEFFEKQVRPILVTRCFECHSGQPGSAKGGLRLDSRAAALKGGDTGPAVVPQNIADSLLIAAINYGDLYQMPPKSRLPADEVAALTKCVEMGAPWPTTSPPATTLESPGGFDLAKRQSDHWCWQPIKATAPPPVADDSWIRQPLDRFILSRLADHSLSPAPPADQQTLLRRAHFDLTGLPPPADLVERFANLSPSLRPSLSPSPDRTSDRNYEALIDSLLASPRFGERWARHWLDLVRYSESRGHEFDYTIPNAFEYRDYVIRALNDDLPYDQFVIEHLAGDLLEHPRLSPDRERNESILGTGFWFLGEWCHSPVDIRKDECDRLDNMLDVFSKTFLGLTVACARCHDHKFDAISQRDYYALAGYLKSSSYRLARFETWSADRALAAELATLNQQTATKLASHLAATLRPRARELTESLLAQEDAVKVLDVWDNSLTTGQVIADYRQSSTASWLTDGPTFGTAPVPLGQFLMTGLEHQPLEVAEYGAARRDPHWPELAIAAGSENDPGRLAGWVRAGRTLKTPTFTLTSGALHYLIEGVGHVYAVVDSHAMINGPLHAELLKETGGNGDLPMRWITHDLSRYVGHRLHLEFSPQEDEDFRLLLVVDQDQRPPSPAARPNRLWPSTDSSPAPPTRASTIAAAIDATIAQLAASQLPTDSLTPDRARLANWLIAQIDLTEPPPPIAELLTQYAAQRTAIVERIRPAARVALAMWDGTPVDEPLLIRGNHKTPGPLVPRASLTALSSIAGNHSPPPQNRLDLAHHLVAPANPLTSRVIVNRVWQHLLGRGIVASSDNFGVLGVKPTHPELLDYLADEFVRDGWSLKRLIRRIMLSSTYRMASARREPPAAVAEQQDPENLLFHRQNVKRLEGEALRDAILAVSGSLNHDMYGPSVPVYLTPFMQGRGRPKDAGPLDGAGRRSIYVAVRRNFLSPLMTAFDTPLPFTTIGRRNVSNVPAQALILMNDPFITEQATRWARQINAHQLVPEGDRLRQMYLTAFGREPTAPELQAAQSFLQTQAAEYGLSPDQTNDERLWADLAHVLFNVKDFVLIP